MMQKNNFRVLKVGAACTILLSGMGMGGGMAFAETTAIPVKAPIAVNQAQQEKITVREEVLTSASDLLLTHIRVPQLAGLQDNNYQEQFNWIILSHAEKDLKHWEQEAAEEAAKAEAEGYTYHPYELTIGYEWKSDGTKDGVVSLVVTTEGATGGTSMPRIDTYNVRNVEEAERITLEDLFGPDVETRLNEAIGEIIREHPEDYIAEEFQGIGTEQAFYIENGEAVIVFPKYSIAPGAAGPQEFRFKLADSQAELLPLREVSEALGYTVNWSAEQKAAVLKKANAPAYTLSLAEKDPNAAPVLKEGKIFVPTAFFSEILGEKRMIEGNRVTLF